MTAASVANKRLRSNHSDIGTSPERSTDFPAGRGYHAAAASANAEKEPVFRLGSAESRGALISERCRNVPQVENLRYGAGMCRRLKTYATAPGCAAG
jgi:hypothetical protein